MRRLLVILTLGSLLAISASRAATIRFSTDPGAVADTLPISVDAVLEVTSNAITVTLTNYQDNPTSVIQNLNSLTFQVTGTLLQQLGLTSSSAPQVNVAHGGAPSYLPAASTGWKITSSGNSISQTVSLCVLCPGAAGPSRLLMGNPGPGGVYDNANGSIAENTPHNPFLRRQAVYYLSAPGVFAVSQISNASFAFGTTAGTTFTGDAVPEVPEPATSVLLGCGAALILVSASMRKASRKKS